MSRPKTAAMHPIHPSFQTSEHSVLPFYPPQVLRSSTESPAVDLLPHVYPVMTVCNLLRSEKNSSGRPLHAALGTQSSELQRAGQQQQRRGRLLLNSPQFKTAARKAASPCQGRRFWKITAMMLCVPKWPMWRRYHWTVSLLSSSLSTDQRRVQKAWRVPKTAHRTKSFPSRLSPARS